MRRVVLILMTILLFLNVIACKNEKEASDKRTYTIDELFGVAKEHMDTTQMSESDAEMLDALMQIKADEFTEMKYMAPTTNLNTNQILIIKGNDEIDKKIDSYLETQIELYASYLPEQAEKLKKAKKFKVNDFIILLVGNSEEEVEKTKEAMEK